MVKINKSEIILKGIWASAGEIEGRVKVIKDLNCPSRDFQEGDVLVAKITNPAMIMIISQAGAIITDIGGITSHPAIVARELNVF